MRKCVFFAILALFMIGSPFANEPRRQDIGRVEQRRSSFTVFTHSGSRISSAVIGSGYSLIGWGSDFFVVQNGYSLYSHDIRTRRMANWSPYIGITENMSIAALEAELSRSDFSAIVYRNYVIITFPKKAILIKLDGKLRQVGYLEYLPEET